jgi:hypothetical protein
MAITFDRATVVFPLSDGKIHDAPEEALLGNMVQLINMRIWITLQ